MPVSLEEEFSLLQTNNFSKDGDTASDILPEEALERPPSSEEVIFYLFCELIDKVKTENLRVWIFLEYTFVSCS